MADALDATVPAGLAAAGHSAGRVVDAHLHLWDPSRFRYPWFAGDPVLDRPYLPEHWTPGASGVTSIVVVEGGCLPGQALDEATWLLEQSTRSALPVAAIVAHAPLASSAHGRWLDAFRGTPSVHGVRRLLFGEPEETLLGAALRDGLVNTAARGLTFDLGVGWRQLGTAAQMLAAVEGLRVVLDHVGDPPLGEGWNSDERREWSRGLRRLAAVPGVVVKLSGLGPGVPAGRSLAAARPYLEQAIEVFGPHRCMVGSDWPRSTHAADGDRSYDAWFDLVLDQTGLDAVECDAVASSTARRCYRLGDGSHTLV